MKKLSKLLCAVLVLALLCSSLIFAVSAEDASGDSEHNFEPNLIHVESSFGSVNTFLENVVASDVEGNLFTGSSTGNAQDILSVAGSTSDEFSYITFYANADGVLNKVNPFYQLDATAPEISVASGSTAYYVIDFDAATHGNLLSYIDVSVMLRRVSDGSGFPFSANVPFAEYVSPDGTWSHITIIGDIAANQVHLFVDGEYKATPGYAFNADQLSGNTKLTPKGVRVDFALSNGAYSFKAGDNAAFDNFSERIYTEAELSDGLAEALAKGNLSDWSGYNSGNSGKRLPAVAKVNGAEVHSNADLGKIIYTNDYIDVEFLHCPLTPVTMNANATVYTNGMSFDSLIALAGGCEIDREEGEIVYTKAPFSENYIEEKLNIPGNSDSGEVYNAIKYNASDNLLARVWHNSHKTGGWGTPGYRNASLITNLNTGNVIYRENTIPNAEGAFTGSNEYVNFNFTSQNLSYENGKSEYFVIDLDYAPEAIIEDQLSLQLIPRNGGSGRWASDLRLMELDVKPGEMAHLTVIYDLTSAKAHIFINGEYFTEIKNGAVNPGGHDEYLSGTKLSCQELKLTSDHKFGDVYLDNLYIRFFDLNNSEDELKKVIDEKELDLWSANIFDEDYEIAKLPAIATVDGEYCYSVEELEKTLTGNKSVPAIVKVLHVFDEPVTVSCDATIYTYGQAVTFVDPYGNEFVPVDGVIKYDAPYQDNREENILSIPGKSKDADVLKAIKGSAEGNLLSGVYFCSAVDGGYLWGTPGYRTASLVTNLDTGDVFYRESAILNEDGGMASESNEYVNFNFDTVTLSYEEGKNEYIVADFDFGTDGTVSDDIAIQLVPRSGSGAWAAPIVLRELHVNRGEMAHITLIFDFTENYAHVYLNGKLIYSVSGGAMDNGAWKSNYVSGTYYTVSELKLCSDKKTSTVCFDNINIRAFDNAVEEDAILGAVESGYTTDWADSIYNSDYVTCAIPTLAVIDGVEYGSADEVNKVLSVETDGQKNIEFKHAPACVIKVQTDARIETNALSVEFDWNTGIYAFEIDDEWYVSTESGLAYASSKLVHNVDGTAHIFETITQENCWYNATPVTWYLDDSFEKYDVVFYVYGDQIKPLNDRTYVKGKNLYKDQWKAIELTDDGYTIGDVVESYPTAGPNVGEKFYVYSPLTQAAPFAAVDLRVSAVVNTNIALTVYVMKSQTVSEGEIFVLGRYEYIAITFDIDPTEVDKIFEAEFLVADTYGNVYTQVYDICFLDYAKKILKNNYSEADKKIVANLLAYANEAHALLDETGEGIPAVEEVLNTYSYYLVDEELGEKADTSELSSVIRSAALNLNSAPEFVFKVARGFRGTVELSYLSLGEEVKVAYTVDARVSEEIIVLSGLNVYDLCGDITITITEEGADAPIVGTYNLTSYAQSVENNGFAKALLAYSKLALEYMSL